LFPTTLQNHAVAHSKHIFFVKTRALLPLPAQYQNVNELASLDSFPNKDTASTISWWIHWAQVQYSNKSVVVSLDTIMSIAPPVPGGKMSSLLRVVFLVDGLV
jgi:hypothetical protein